MPKISVLPEEVRSKIAAGEVVERPASVVKELVENAFDAGGNTIKVWIKGGGLEEIGVYDDGEGMEKEDLEVCYLHHATSKIKSAADVFRIATYGFRGEALASIASVSKLVIKSKAVTSSEGYELEVEFGRFKGIKPSKIAKGTLVLVKRLFSNVPARKAFLKSQRSETLRVAEVLKSLALCFPEKRYELKSTSASGRESVLFSWQGGDLRGIVATITGVKEETFKERVLKHPPYEIEVLITDTSNTFPHTKYLFTLVNRRLVKDERLNRIILSAIKPFFGHLGYPAGVIHIRAPFHLVDVNVHPAKWEVRFRYEKDVAELIKKGVEEVLGKKRHYYFSTKEKFLNSGLRVKEDVKSLREAEEDLDDIPDFSVKPELKENTSEEIGLFKEKPLKSEEFRFIGSFLNTYLIVEKNSSLYLIDQHALCERVIFERLKEEFLKKKAIQKFLFPLLIKVSEEAFDDVSRRIEVLEALGFGFEVLGRGEVLLKEAPQPFKEDIKEVIEEVLEEPAFYPEGVSKELLARYACRLARKKGDAISREEAEYLIREMFDLDLTTCPHGRPVYIVITEKELEKKLKRQV